MAGDMTGQRAGRRLATWAWPVQPPNEASSWIWALLLLALGAAAFVLWGDRNRPGDLEA